MSKIYDVCVIGGGPAGASLALRLAKLGRRVLLLERETFPRPAVGESLTRGVLPLLEVLGVREEIERAGIVRAPVSTVWWGGAWRRRETLGGFQVDRAHFDGRLFHAARTAGVDVRQGARVSNTQERGEWTVSTKSGETFQARFLANCTGRTAFLSGRKERVGAPTVALFASWSGVDSGDGGSIIEAGESHWSWGAPLPGGLFSAMVFLDPAAARVERYPHWIAQSKLLRERLHSGVCGEVRACSATACLDKAPVSANTIKAGDAALSLDPLSSQGVQTAIGTALHAAVVINTVLDYPERRELATGFYERRLRASSALHAAAARKLYREQFAIAAADFWRNRSGEAEHVAPAPHSPLGPEEWIQLSSSVRIGAVAGVSDRYVFETEGIECRGKETVFLGHARAADLLQALAKPMLARELFHCWCAMLPPDDALRAVQGAWAEGWIERAESTPRISGPEVNGVLPTQPEVRS